MKKLLFTLITTFSATIAFANCPAQDPLSKECTEQVKVEPKKVKSKKYKVKEEKIVEVYGGQLGPKSAVSGNPKEMKMAGVQTSKSFDPVLMTERQAKTYQKKVAKKHSQPAQ